jgi:hypothetical protein
MFIASVITGWFVARDAADFDLIQLAIALLLIIFFIMVGAFWPYLDAWVRNRRHPESRADSF